MTTSRSLSFSDPFIIADLFEAPKAAELPAGIIVNLSSEPMIVHGQVDSIVPPWRSTNIAMPTKVTARLAARLSVSKKDNLGGVQWRGWDWYGQRNANFSRDTPLFISPQDTIGDVIADPYAFGNQPPRQTARRPFKLKLNLWWSPPRTDCSIHNEHSFLEVHTQVFGTGRMQKFWERQSTTIYEDVPMAPGQTHEPFFTVRDDGSWIYPWHRYYADTDCVWLAIELHPA
jgi:hypothetical protein